MNNLLRMKKTMTMVLSLVMMLSLAAPVMAQNHRAAPGMSATASPSQAPGPSDPAELEVFLDELIGKQMAENHVAGAAISVVKDSQLLFAKGYGYADIEKGIPVDPDQTIFSIGSIGKVFTWTAVMQLVEQGKLDLEADINTYLDFRISDTFPQPVTLKHLMTHTSGFEDRWFGSAVSDANDLEPVREFLISFMPARVRPPGEIVAYSNYNAALAGYIVSQVSGQPYEQYIQDHILDPLGMQHSTVRSPIPPELRPYASKGYWYENGVFQILPDYIGQPAGLPSGAHKASVTDMARFMIAHLQGGRYSDANTAEVQILKETTAQQMHTTLYAPDPRLLGNAYGFFDWSDNGQRTLGHRGYLPPMNSLLLLLPDQNLGVFVTYNSESAKPITNPHFGFQRAFFDHYYPSSAVEPIQPPVEFVEQAGRFEGNYEGTGASYTTLAKIFQFFNQVELSDSGEGTLTLTIEGNELRFVAVEPLYFRQVDGPFSLVFREDEQGRITSMYTDLTPFQAFEKLDWYETAGFNMALALGSVLIFLSMIPVVLIRAIRNRRRGGDRNPSPRGARAAHWILLAISVLNLLFLVGVVLGMTGIMQNVLLDPPLILKIALGLDLLSAVLTAGALVYIVMAWKNRYWGITARAYYTLVTLSAAAFVWFLNYWNLLGWRY
jgi:CubicO group peptidase (beta-lactamase class C family)